MASDLVMGENGRERTSDLEDEPASGSNVIGHKFPFVELRVLTTLNSFSTTTRTACLFLGWIRLDRLCSGTRFGVSVCEVGLV